MSLIIYRLQYRQYPSVALHCINDSCKEASCLPFPIKFYVYQVRKPEIQVPVHNFIHQIHHTRNNVLIITSIILLTDVVYTLRCSHFCFSDSHLFLLIMKFPWKNPRLLCPKYLLGYTIHTTVDKVHLFYFCTRFKIRVSLTSKPYTVLSSYWILLAQIVYDFISLCLLYVHSASI